MRTQATGEVTAPLYTPRAASQIPNKTYCLFFHYFFKGKAQVSQQCYKKQLTLALIHPPSTRWQDPGIPPERLTRKRSHPKHQLPSSRVGGRCFLSPRNGKKQHRGTRTFLGYAMSPQEPELSLTLSKVLLSVGSRTLLLQVQGRPLETLAGAPATSSTLRPSHRSRTRYLVDEADGWSLTAIEKLHIDDLELFQADVKSL